MKKFLLGICLLFFFQDSFSGIFFVDPVNGSMSNNGSDSLPWSNLQDLITYNKIHSKTPQSHPYDYYGALIAFNSSAPVKAGDTIMCFGGYQGDLLITNYYNELPIVVMSVTGASVEFNSIKIVASSNWIFEGIRISGSFSDSLLTVNLSTPFLAEVQSHNWLGPCHDITFQNCEAFTVDEVLDWTATNWTDYERGGFICRYKSRRINFLNNVIRNIRYGIHTLSDSSIVSGNQIVNFSEDGIRHQGNNIIISDNVIKNSFATNPIYHRDGIQSLVQDSMKDVRIERNTILHYDPNDPHPFIADLQGITGFNEGFHVGWHIVNNLVVVNSYHGITICGAIGCNIVNNTVIDAIGNDAYVPRIWIDSLKPQGGPNSSSLANMLINNVAPEFLIIADFSYTESNYIAGFTTYDTIFEAPALFNFHLLSGSPLRNSGSATNAPDHDLDLLPRPLGTAHEIGCYEFYECAFSFSHDTVLLCEGDSIMIGSSFVSLQGDYTDTIISFNTGCDSLIYYHVVLHDKPVVDLGPDINGSGEITLSIPDLGYSIIWSTGDTTSSIQFNITQNDTVWVLVSNGYCFSMDEIYITFDDHSGVEEKDTDFILVYPIPFKNVLSLEFKTNSKVNLIGIFDINARIVFTGESISSSENLNLEWLPAGLYQIQVLSSDGKVFHKTIIKSN